MAILLTNNYYKDCPFQQCQLIFLNCSIKKKRRVSVIKKNINIMVGLDPQESIQCGAARFILTLFRPRAGGGGGFCRSNYGH